MLQYIYRYGALIFMLNTIFVSGYVFQKTGYMLFYGMMGLYAMLVLLHFRFFLTTLLLKPLWILFAIDAINLLHLILFDRTFDAFIYFVTKLVIFFIIAASIYTNLDYYRDRFFQHLVYIGGFFAFASLLFSQNFTSGYHGIIGNRNEFGLLMSTTAGVLYLYKENLSVKEKWFLVLLLVLVLMSASRNALIGIVLAWIFRNGLSWRILAFLPIFGAAYFVLDYFHIETSINRLASEEDVLSDRRKEWLYAFLTFLNKPITGYGLDHYAYIDLSLVPTYYFKKGLEIMAHNSYLAALVQYGAIFATFVFGAIAAAAYPLYRLYLGSEKYRQNKAVKIYLYILTFTFISSIFESHMFGVNAFHGFMFWFSLAMSSVLYYLYRSGRLEGEKG